MKVLRVRHRETEINVSFVLNRFIADWPSAQSKFISGIADGFREWFSMSPRDFSVTPALALEDLRCRCRIFGGQCEIALVPEALQLDFENVKQDDRPVVQKTIRKASEWLTGALEDHGRDLFSFETIAHLEAFKADALDAYLGRLMPAGADELTKSEPDVKYLPSMHTVLSGETEGWQLWRVVEKSRLIENAVFVDTRVQVTYPDSPGSIEFDDLMRLLDRAEKLADRAVGLDCEGE